MRRTAPLLLFAIVVAACDEPAPTREFAIAKQAFDKAMDATLMDFTDPRFDEVLDAFDKVPGSNPKERSKADALSAQILDARAAKRARGAALEAIPKAPPTPALPPSTNAPSTSEFDLGGCYARCEQAANEQLARCQCEAAFGAGSPRANEDNVIKVNCQNGTDVMCVPHVDIGLKQCQQSCEFRANVRR